MEENDKQVKVIDKRHFTSDGVRREVEDAPVFAEPPASPEKDRPETNAASPVAQADEHFGELVAFIAQNALAALGRLQVPGGGRTPVNLEAAATMIEWLEAIERKSGSNLAPEEKQLLKDYVYQLKMVYIEARQGGK